MVGLGRPADGHPDERSRNTGGYPSGGHGTVALAGLPAAPPLAPLPPAVRWSPEVQLILVRHGQSANKESRKLGHKAAADPGLTDLGHAQAEVLGERLRREYGQSAERGEVMVVSSPMRRCLLTIQPMVQMTRLAPRHCWCHGGCYEYGCAGAAHSGTTSAEISGEFPEFRPVGFSDQDTWDYCGENDKESEPECRARCLRIARWLHAQREAGAARTIFLVIHQTIADVLCRLFLEGHADAWEYGDIRFKLSNACLTQVSLLGDGTARIGVKNDGGHLWSLKGR